MRFYLRHTLRLESSGWIEWRFELLWLAIEAFTITDQLLELSMLR